MTIKIVEVSSNHADLAIIIKKLDEYLLQKYPAEEIFGVDFSEPKVNDITFIVAYLNEVPVGCGAIREIDKESTELKRFFVEQDFRNRGIAYEILMELELRAKTLGYTCIKLEAGEPQTEALSFYRKNGYYQIDRFGEYVACESSICYEKKLKV
ncbi:GNAT family N-acetyltransferase [Paenibacillus antarcticus]|uniref:GCN5 family acetyltransferase n=1 Tax=Paenibacillus antarcticus TaxID=253703 RepID=A0A168NA63_9BACL|nr:GNAT family N-acetyltransferase [Paenibacillus antarcticus]OAB45569.1 GCN5 family acetyltransferase [Paenibacillus antarcticus]